MTSEEVLEAKLSRPDLSVSKKLKLKVKYLNKAKVNNRREEKQQMLEEFRVKIMHDREIKRALDLERAIAKSTKQERLRQELAKVDPMELYTQKLMVEVEQSNEEVRKKHLEALLTSKAPVDEF
jgi:hypothetical protein